MKRQIKIYVSGLILCGALTLGFSPVPSVECASGACEDECSKLLNKCRASGKKQDVCNREYNGCLERCKNRKP